MSIHMREVKSSQIAKIGYDATSKTLAVQFNSGSTYHYHDVPASTHDALVKAPSLGKYFGAHIKGNKDIKYTRVEEPKHD